MLALSCLQTCVPRPPTAQATTSSVRRHRPIHSHDWLAFFAQKTTLHRVRAHRWIGLKAAFHPGWANFWFFYPACDGQVVDAEGALEPTNAGALQVSTQNLLTNFLRVRLLGVETAVATASFALVFFPTGTGETIAFELIAVKIRAKIFYFFDDHGLKFFFNLS